MKLKKVTALILTAILSTAGLLTHSLSAAAASALDVPDVSVSYQTHIQNIGWQDVVKDGAVSGTVGRSFRLEAIKINVTGNENLFVYYRTHVQQLGWGNGSSNGEMSGTSGRSYRMEAISMSLLGSDQLKYDIYYRVHCQDHGWLGWAKNGGYAGTQGQSRRLEAIEIKVVKRGGSAPGDTNRAFIAAGAPTLKYQIYDREKGWQQVVKKGPAEAYKGISDLNLMLENKTVEAPIEVHMWNDWSGVWTGDTAYSETPRPLGVANGPQSTQPITAIKLNMLEPGYDIYYRVDMWEGWMNWFKNGEIAGMTPTAGWRNYHSIKRIEIKIVKKGDPAPKS